MKATNLVIRHRGGSSAHSAGVAQTFLQRRIRIGRGDDCELRFDPHADRAVSTAHAEILADEDGVRVVDSGSRNGVFVNGKRVASELALKSGDLVRLGADGPQFEVEFGETEPGDDLRTIQAGPAPQTMPRVDGSGSPPPVPGTGPGRVSPRVRPFGGPAPGTPGEAVAPHPAAMGGPAGRPMPGVPPHPAAPPPASPPGAGVPEHLAGKKSIGINTLMNVVDQTVQRERQRTKKILVPVVATLAAVVLALVFWPRAEALQWREVLGGSMQSVYVCATLEAGNARPFGTAWSIGDGMLATNSHVAEFFEKLRPGQQLIVRSCSTPPRDLRIAKVTMHPGFRQWSKLCKEYDPYVAGQGFQRMLPPACDVALLHVADDDVGLLAPALPIASNSDLLDIQPGDPMALVGYPMEGQAGQGVNMDAPFPQLRAGSVSRATNYFFGRDDPENCRLIGLSIESAGGASGSPVFNARGQVVALNSAGDYLDVGVQGRRIRSGGAYGQRVDVLRDLIKRSADKDGEKDGDTDDSELEQAFLERFRKGVEHPEAFAHWLATQAIDRDKQSLGKPNKTVVRIETSGQSGAKTETFTVARSGLHVRVVLPLTRPVPPEVATSSGRGFRPNKPIGYFILDRGNLSAGSRMQTRIQVPSSARMNEPLEYVCFWFPVQS